MATAMYSPEGEYKQAKTPAEEKVLRKKGYVNGHEYFMGLILRDGAEALAKQIDEEIRKEKR